MYNFGGSSFSVGAYLYGLKYQHNKSKIAANEDGDTEGDTTIGLLPQAEYNINDTFNLRTIVRSNIYDNTYGDKSEYNQRLITQSIGLGISVNRDIYLYPNIQFVPQEAKPEITNIAVSATVNMF